MTSERELASWFAGRVVADWFIAPVEVETDRDEILVIGRLAEPSLGADATEAEISLAIGARISGFREDTRDHRVRIAGEAEHRFGRKVSWAARCGEVEERFTVASVPVMTRLRLDERRVLDTLIDAGVARSRSEALAWCVRLVGDKQSEWIDSLRDALTAVEEVRAQGPTVEFRR